MKEKIKSALKQEYKSLGLSEEAFERVAELGKTFVTSDEQVATYVKGAEAILKAEQSAADRVRTELNAKIKAIEGEKAELEDKLNKGNGTPGGNTDPEPEPTKQEEIPAYAQKLIDSYKELNDRFTTFMAKQTQDAAVTALDKFVGEWDYAKGFPKESELSKRIALKVYKAGGEKMTGEELIAAFREEFDPAVKAKGVTDFTQPYKSEGQGNAAPDFKNEVELLKAAGVPMPE